MLFLNLKYIITKTKRCKIQLRFAAKRNFILLQNTIAFCCKTKLHFAAKQKTTSEGVLGHVFCK